MCEYLDAYERTSEHDGIENLYELMEDEDDYLYEAAGGDMKDPDVVVFAMIASDGDCPWAFEVDKDYTFGQPDVAWNDQQSRGW